MFGTNSVTGKKFFKDAPVDSLFVTSMFFTLQGEGPYAGLPALFIRLAKCQLSCRFCDTYFDQGDWMTYDQIEARAYQTICDYWNNQGESVPLWAMPVKPDMEGPGPYSGIVLVITGGEPTLQDNLTQFLVRQQFHYRAVQIETNGLLTTRIPNYVTIVCSPKCAEKDGKANKYLKPSQYIMDNVACLKFVMCADHGSPYSFIPDWAFEWRDALGGEIYVSPMNVYNDVPQQSKILRLQKGEVNLQERSTIDEVISFWTPGLLNPQQNQLNHEYTAKYALKHGLRLSLQQHLYASMA